MRSSLWQLVLIRPLLFYSTYRSHRLPFFFQKVCNEAHTVLSFLPHSQVCMLKVESRSSCSFPALQLCPAGRRSICYCIFWINMSESLWSHPTEHPQWKIFFLVKTELTFIHVVFTRTTGRMPMCSRSSGVSARRSALVTCFIWLHLSRMIWFNYFLIVRFSSCHVHQQTSVLCFCSNTTGSADRGRGRQCSESTLRFSSTPETSFPKKFIFDGSRRQPHHPAQGGASQTVSQTVERHQFSK